MSKIKEVHLMGFNIEIKKGNHCGKKVIIDGVEQKNVVSVTTKITNDKVDTVLVEYKVDLFTLDAKS